MLTAASKVYLFSYKTPAKTCRSTCLDEAGGPKPMGSDFKVEKLKLSFIFTLARGFWSLRTK